MNGSYVYEFSDNNGTYHQIIKTLTAYLNYLAFGFPSNLRHSELKNTKQAFNE